MKKKLLLSIALYSMHFGLYAQKDYSVKDLVNYFKEIEVPFTTEQLNFTHSELPYDISLMYFFRNDSAFSYYYYEIENMEDHTIMESGYEKKSVIPCSYYYLNGKLLLIYELYSSYIEDHDPEIFLAIFNDCGVLTDSLIISYATVYSSAELYNFVKSKIYEDKIIVFNYNLIMGKERNDNGIKTSIQVTHYVIDTENEKFIETKTEKFQSKKYELYQFDERESEEVKQEDPYYKY